MVCPSSRSGAGQDLISTFFKPRAMLIALGWRKVMASTGSSLEGPEALLGGRSPRSGRHRTGGSDLGNDAGDAVEGPDVDGVGGRTGGSGSAPQATHWGMALAWNERPLE